MAKEAELSGDLSEGFVRGVLSPRGVDPLSDKLLGAGYRMTLGGAEAPVEVDVFPEASAAILSSRTGQIELAPITHVLRREGRLWMVSEGEQDYVAVALSPTGGVSFVRRSAGEVAQEEAAKQRRSAEVTGEIPRVTLRGRVGRVPSFRTSQARRMLVAHFPLAEHVGEDQTVWHQVVVFGDRAARLQEKPLRVGQEIEIVGYPHEKERRTREGGARRVTEIYATAVRTTLTNPPRP